MKGPPNRRVRRALQKGRGNLTAIEGGKPVAPDTPPQRFAAALEKFVATYLRGHGGLDALNVTKVVMQYGAKMAIDHDAKKAEYVMAAEHVFDEAYQARYPVAPPTPDKDPA